MTTTGCITLWNIPNIHMTYICIYKWISKVTQDISAADANNKFNDTTFKLQLNNIPPSWTYGCIQCHCRVTGSDQNLNIVYCDNK